MAWQLHYTSARSGPTGRSGFQFVAATPGLPPGVQAAVTPFMTYRPPPGAPFEKLDGLPIALAYDLVGERALLTRCRYLGQDYSGRYGNFFAHAVVAEPQELEGLRPIELWQAELWDELPDGGELAALEDVIPGAAVAPEALAGWLAGAGRPALLTRLVDAVVATLGRGHGRVVLIAGDTELIARWIAVVSYSLPVSAAARMSFITYSGDPGGAPQRIVGTTPDAWATAHLDDALSITLDGAHEPGGADGHAPASRFARTVADCWRDLDFAGLDALGELALVQEGSGEPLAVPLDRAAALLALCRGEAEGSPEEEAAAAELLTGHGARVPDWVRPELVPALPGVGFDLALAMHSWARDADAREVADRCAARCVILALRDAELRARLPEFRLPPEALDRLVPIVADSVRGTLDLTEVAGLLALAVRSGVHVPGPAVREAAAGCARSGAADLPAALAAAPVEWREPLTEGVFSGLTGADEAAWAAVLTDEACDLLESRDWAHWPDVGLHVLASVGRRRRDRRVEVTGALLRLDLGVADLDAVLSEVWSVAPSVPECGALLDAYASEVGRFPALAAVPSRTFAGADDLEDPALVRVALRVLDAFSDRDRAALDAAVVRACAEAIGAERPEPAARALRTIDMATVRLAKDAFPSAAHRLARRDPRFRAALLATATPSVRSRLVGCWVEHGGRGRWGRGGMPTAQRNELVEVALRLRRLGVTEPDLDAWARGVAAKRIASRQLDTHLRDDRELRAALKDLRAQAGADTGAGTGAERADREG